MIKMNQINSNNILFVTSNMIGELSPNFCCVCSIVNALKSLDIHSDVMVIGNNDEIEESNALLKIPENTKNVFFRYITKIYKFFFMPVGDFILVHKIRQAVKKILSEKNTMPSLPL